MSVQQPEALSVLLPGKLNVVGEFHSESGGRRDLEKAFVKEKTGSDNYWTEAQFLDLHYKVGTRKKRGGQGEAGDQGADLMEFRAAHGAAMLIDKFDKLCDEASRVAGISDDSARAAVVAFVTHNLKPFSETKKQTARTWQPTLSADVNKAVQDVYDTIDSVLAKYIGDMKDHLAAVNMLLEDTKVLAGSRAAVDALVQPLSTAVGASQAGNAEELAGDMRKQRSAFMGLATTVTSLDGVWKVGNGHVQDLMNGTAKVDMSKANFVTRDDFNAAYEQWKLEKFPPASEQKPGNG